MLINTKNNYIKQIIILYKEKDTGCIKLLIKDLAVTRRYNDSKIKRCILLTFYVRIPSKIKGFSKF